MTQAERELLIATARALGSHLIWSLGGNRNDGCALLELVKKVEAERTAGVDLPVGGNKE